MIDANAMKIKTIVMPTKPKKLSVISGKIGRPKIDELANWSGSIGIGIVCKY